jgi:arylsulfatase A-like enzyme
MTRNTFSTNRPRLGILAIVMAGLGAFFLLRDKGVEGLVPVIRESRIDLLQRLSPDAQISGFPEHSDWLAPYADVGVNVDHPSIPVLLPQNGEIAFRAVPLHRGAKLHFTCGVEAIHDPAAIGARVTFGLEVRGKGGAQELLSTAIEVPSAPLPLRNAFTVELASERFGDIVDVRFRVATDRDLPELAFLPALGSPMIESAGVKSRVSELTQHCEELVLDLIAAYPAANDADEEREDVVLGAGHPDAVFAIQRFRDGRTSELPTVQRAVVPAFDAAGKFDGKYWGPYPAIAFGLDGTIVRYAVDVPREGAHFVGRIGIDRRSIGVGAAEFSVSVDGGRVFARRLEPGASKADAGWHDVEIDLAPFAGKRVMLALEGELSAGTPMVKQAEETTPLGATVPYELEVRRVMAAFGEPRIVRRITVPRRLAAKRDPPRPSVIFVNIETLRADVLGCYGGDPDLAPALDRFAREGVRVDPCISVAPWTAPSVASVFTGLYPYAHGVVSYAQSYLAETLDTLAEKAAREGVTTAAFVTNDLISPRKNFEQGFETFQLLPYANAGQVLNQFEYWLEDNRDLQFFAYLHLFEPHDPCNAPGDDRERFVPESLRGADSRAALDRIKTKIAAGDPPAPDDPDVRLLRGLYLGEIRYADRKLERLRELLESKGLLGRVVVVISGDHGEEFCEHGLIGHGSHCFEESVAVPLVFFGPGIVPAGLTIDGPVENTTIFATILSLLGVPFDERAVEPALDFAGGSNAGGAYSSTEQGIRSIGPDGLKVKTVHRLRQRTRSFVFSPRGDDAIKQPAQCLAFDLESDPREVVDRSREPTFDVATLRNELERAWKFAHSQSHGIAVDAIDSHLANQLRALGYTSGARTNAIGALFAPGDDCGTK